MAQGCYKFTFLSDLLRVKYTHVIKLVSSLLLCNDHRAFAAVSPISVWPLCVVRCVVIFIHG